MVYSLWKKSLEVSYKTKHIPTVGPAIPLLGIYTREMKTHIHEKHLYKNFHRSYICNSQSLETIQVEYFSAIKEMND